MKTPANKSSDHQPRGSERKATGAANMEHFNQMVKARALHIGKSHVSNEGSSLQVFSFALPL
jgi:hypothetical protein